MDSEYLSPCFLLYQRIAQLELVLFSAKSRTVEEGSTGAQGDIGGLYVLNLRVWTNGQEKIM